MTKAAQIWLALAWCLCLALIAVALSVRLDGYRFEASLLSLLPHEEQNTEAAQRVAMANQHLTQLVDRELLLLVGAKGPAAAALSAEWAARVQAALASDQRQPQPVDLSQLSQFSQNYFPYRYFLLAPADRAQLQEQAVPLIRAAQRQLYSPMAAGYQPVDDPFWLFQRYLQALAAQSPVTLLGDWPTLQSEGNIYRLLRFRIQGSAFDAKAQADLADLLDELQALFPDDVELLSSGLVVHAAYGARMARQEISTVGVGSMIGVLALLWMSLGARSVFVLLSCVSAGILVAMTASVWWFDSLHLITLAFGASLIGVGIDYGIHARMALANGERLRAIFPALLLGLITSLLAYGIQGAMPFPGLQQMALFSCVGLVGAWVSTCVWMPLVAMPPGAVKTQPKLAGAATGVLLRSVARYWQRSPSLRMSPLAVAILLILGLILLWRLPGDDRLASLQTSPQALVEQEAAFRNLMQRGGLGQFYLVAAQTEIELDEKLLSLAEQLAALKKSGALGDYQSLHDWRPALSVQRENRALYSTLLFEDGPEWFNNLSASDLYPQARAALENASEPLYLSQWQKSMPQPQFYFAEGNWHYAIVPVQGIRDEVAIRALESNQIHFVDRPAAVARLLAYYRVQLQQWTAAAIFLVLGLLAWRFGVGALPLLAVPVMAAIVVAAVLSALDILTLFHCLALLLVLGIGFDSCIFLWLGREPNVVWQATSLSVLTSGISFGLLALSNTPVLHFFGVTVLCGLSLMWLLIPAVYKGVLKQP